MPYRLDASYLKRFILLVALNDMYTQRLYAYRLAPCVLDISRE